MTKKRLKIILVPVVVVLMFLFFVGTINAATCTDHDVWGWAWSENIGWISFSCRDTMDIGVGVDYGVDIDGAGIFSGYAWSENIGWISFNVDELNGCPSGTCNASINSGTGVVSGWARALANGGGWDGWIKLSGTWANGVILNSTPDPSEFEGWAWGSDVVGWISFNSITGGGATPYAVMTNFFANSPPIAAITCNPSCTIYETEVLVLENNSTDPENNIVESEWATESQATPGYTVHYSCVVDPILCDFTPQTYVGLGDFRARLIVKDAGALSDTATINFSILRDASAGFRCSLDNLIWNDCDTIVSISEELVYFIDNQDIDSNEYSQASQGEVIISRTWQRSGDASPFSDANNQNPFVMATLPSMDITLDIVDSAGRTSSRTHTIGVEMPLPDWREIAPF